VVIGDNVWLGVNSVVLKGVTIGKNSVIGANSVVTRDIPPNVIAAGNPCKVIKQIQN
jgi:acetyltransferase-like isoleucine patch superfamily enzyme